MHAFYNRMFQEASAECAICTGGEEDCSHLFFGYSFAPDIGVSQRTSSVHDTSAEAFRGSLMGGTYRSRVEEGRLFAMLWVLKLHSN